MARKGYMDTPDRVAAWLNEVAINSSQDSPHHLNDCEYPNLSRLSPTDTSTSGPSIFDSPSHKTDLQRGRTSDKTIHEDFSDVTSIQDDESPTSAKAERSYQFATTEVTQDYTIEDNGHLDDDAGVLDAAIYSQASLNHGPNEPRMVWITSCLQCTLADLPCSRTPPACSRCKRKGAGKTCLLQRRFFIEEIEISAGAQRHLPILLKLKSDNEDVWRRKLGLAEELRQKWLEEQDRKNWVLPDMHTPRSGYPIVGRGVRVAHPGEGRSEAGRRELYLDLDVEY
ncbi:hypothetical protein BKA66DRAFT_574013 [Pyrenochaeta sp. MPI-SDFR-AT-0127]|nr:hypothetical protein BKA66DRAFT_574013 [Pyrenochaeta sp. MPI-SDFR-AT-0127]